MTNLSFATFSRLDGDPVAINAAMVTSFAPGDDNTIITLTTGETVTTRERFDACTEQRCAAGLTDC